MTVSLYGEVFLTSKITSNGVLESLGNLCLWPLRRHTVCLIGETYSVENHPLLFQENERIAGLMTVLKTTFLFSTGIGILGVGLKGASWLIPSVRNQNFRYIELKLQDGQALSLPFFDRQLKGAKGKDESFFSEWPQELKDSILSFLDKDSIKSLSLTCSHWSIACRLAILYRKVLQKRYPSQWVKSLTLDTLMKIPRHSVSSKVLQTIREPIRCLSPEDLSHSIVQGVKNHVPFLAIRYQSQEIESAETTEGVLIWCKPQSNDNWKDGAAYYDRANVGLFLEKQSKNEQDLFLDCLATLLKRESYNYQVKNSRYLLQLKETV